MIARIFFNDLDITKPNRIQRIFIFTSFILCLFLVPVLIFYIIVIYISRKLWLKILVDRYPNLEFVENTSIRTLLDNHRSQCILNMLMEIRGPCQPLQIRQALMDRIVDKKDRFGNFKYPKLRAGLVSRWGNYAWKSPVYFNVHNHLVIANSVFKGRLISENNIQDYITELVSKCFPANYPPWQVVIIPNISSNIQKYYILIRVHHLLVDEYEPLNIKDFFFLKSNEDTSISDCPSPTSDSSTVPNFDQAKSSLIGIVQPLKALPKLYSLLSYNLSNKWNEFIFKYDPIESPKMIRPPGPGLFHCIAIMIITFVKSNKEYNRTSIVYRSDSIDSNTLFRAILNNELARRNMNRQKIINSIFITFSLENTVALIVKCVSFLLSLFFVKIPSHICHEIVALVTLKRHSSYPNTIVSFVYNYFPLLYKAAKESVYLTKIIYTAPVTLLNELCYRKDVRTAELHELQTESLCGRKVVAWSESVPQKDIEDIARASGATETEVMITMAKKCLYNYFLKSDTIIPKKLLLTARTDTCELFVNSNKYIDSSGIICLALPLEDDDQGDIINELRIVQREIQRVRMNQAALYTLGTKKEFVLKMLPTIVVKVILNYWTRKFSVLLTEIEDNGENTMQETIWGHPLSSFISWKPPQGNICMSLTLQRYAGNVRLCLMSDARLYPLHTNAVVGWKETFEKLKTQLETSGQL